MKKWFVFIAILLSALTNVCQAEIQEAFFHAVKNDNGRLVADFISRGVNPNTLDENHECALLIAVRSDAASVLEVLLKDTKTKFDLVTPKGENALMLAAANGNLKLVRNLIAKGAQVNKKGWTPLHYAVIGSNSNQLAIIKLLLEHHAYMDAASPNKTTPLMMAAHYGTLDGVALLLKEGADPVLRNEQGLNAVDFAKRANRDKVAELIALALTQQKSRGSW